MNRISEFIDEAGIFYLATEDGKQPKVRPLGAHVEQDGKVYFTVGDFKEVYRQMKENPLVEIVAFTPADRKWLRYTGKAVFEENEAAREAVFEELPHLRKVYNENTGNRMMLFTLEDATAVIIDMAGNVETIE